MSANSLLRRTIKSALHPLLNERTYAYVQSLAKAIDIRRGKWYEPELDLIRYGVRAGDEVIDMGANYGLYTYHLSQAVGVTGRVYAFEPVPFTCCALTLVSRLLGLRNVTIVEKGCSDVSARVEFSVPLQKSGAPSAGQAHLGSRSDGHPGFETQVRWDRTTSVTCDVVALDDYLPPLKHLSFIKSDIEGAELLAFRGAAQIIDQHKPSIVCEINPWFFEGFGLRLADLVGFFADRAYRLYRYTDDKRLVAVASRDDIVEDNYVFIHPLRLSAFAPLLDR